MPHPNEPSLEELYAIRHTLYSDTDPMSVKKLEAIEVQIARLKAEKAEAAAAAIEKEENDAVDSGS